MICELCNTKFKVNKKGSGGTNRLICFACIPEGLTKAERGLIRSALMTVKARKEKLRTGCSICGYKKCAAALEWHHKKDDKLINPTELLKRSWTKYKNETKKCSLLCANCHREKHYNDET